MTSEGSPTGKKAALTRVLLGASALGVIAGAAAVARHAHVVERFKLVVEEQDIAVPGWPKSAAGYRLGFLTDFHVRNQEDGDHARRAAEMLMTLRPEVVLLGGDFLSHEAEINAPRISSALESVARARDGAYAVFGNHDWWSKGAGLLARELEGVGIRVLANKAVPLDGADGAWLVGVDSVIMRKSNVRDALADVPPDAPKILLVHEPDYADTAPEGFALQISGHSHAGQVQLPGTGPIVMPRLGRQYPEGLHDGPHHLVYTSRGIGATGAPFRLCCPPEVTLLRLHPA